MPSEGDATPAQHQQLPARFQIVSITGVSTPPSTTAVPATAGTMRDLEEPSDGLEPSTPSLPFRFWDGKRGHTRAFAATKIPQTDGIRQRDVTRVWTRVVGLMFPPCSLACGRRPDRSVPVATALLPIESKPLPETGHDDGSVTAGASRSESSAQARARSLRPAPT